ncbi:Cathepsin F-like protease [Operophtera brumata]|uniref:Cathepsin F-like protease n=1 Tax=Operophtera brumata TaxID=104452 RepID=A0A0L7LQJ2_OPEBR|nr:Cathepsin F-like protease [Operophtera brumata]
MNLPRDDWINKEIIDMINRRNLLWQQIKADKRNEALKNKFIVERNKVGKRISADKSKYYYNEFMKCSNSPKKMWNLINTLAANKIKTTCAPPKIISDSQVITDGCSSHVNPQAPGVSDLASIGVRQLNTLEPDIQHTLNSVVEVERQVQVVNGIRYILTLVIDYNSCRTQESETCLYSKTCKITVLEKPWMKLPDGSKHRAILSNNCTAEWQFGNDGVVIPTTPTDSRENNNINAPKTDDGTDIIKPVHNVDIQSQQHAEKTLTDDEIKVIEEQIIPYKQFDERENESLLKVTSEPTYTSEPGKEHVVKMESVNQLSPNSIPVTNPVKIESLSDDKKKAIDDMLDFLNFADFDSTRPERRMKRDQDFVEAPSNQDVNSPHIQKLAKESLQKYLKTSVYHRHYDLIDILRATVQTVEGTLTKLEFKISPTNCLIDREGNPSSSDCKVLDYNDVTTCTSEIWVKELLHFKDINTTCHANNENTRVKLGLLGGLTEEDPLKPMYKALAEESMQKYLESNGITILHRVCNIQKVTTQVVSGTKTIIIFNISPNDQTMSDVISCKSEIWEQPWIKKKEINVNCDTNNKSRAKRGLPGGETEQDPNDPKYRKLAEESIQEYLKSNGKTNLLELLSIDRVTTQVVAGSLTRLDFKISPADKSKGDVISCHSSIWVQSWLKKKEITVNCGTNNQSRAKREILHNSRRTSFIKENLKGGLQDEDPTKIEYKAIAQDTLKKYLKLQKNYNLHNVVEVKKVATRVVSGIIYYIEYVAAPKSCADDISTCVDEKSVLNCKAQVWDQPWLGKKDVKVHCRAKNTEKRKENNESRKKRSVSLNLSNSTAHDSKIQKMVQESLHKLEMSSSNRYKQKVLQIKSYSTKITSGKVTTIYFDVGYTSCLKLEWVDNVKNCEFLEHLPRRHCVSQVWERLWLDNGRNIEVTCHEDESLLEAPAQFDSAETAMKLANEALKHIEAKYPHPRKQKVVRIFSLEKQIVAGIHYRMKVEVGSTQCSALSAETNCTLDEDVTNNMFCRVNVWLRPWTDHQPNFRVTCDNQAGTAADLYHHLQAEHLFINFLNTYRPGYINNASEMTRRYEIFKTNVRKIHELNTHEKGTATYGVTRFADLSYEEFTRKFLGLKPALQATNQVPMRQAEIPSVHVPDKFDWRDHDAVTEVKNQGVCGSCWAFSELVDCDKLDNGCNGGLPDNAYRAIEQLGGLELENDYPYEGEDDKCSFNKTISKVQITGAV